MKTCPKCFKNVSRRKKEACPECGTLLFDYKGKWRRKSDQTLARTILSTLKPYVEKNLGAGGYMLIPNEWAIAYRVIDTLRNWYNGIQEHPVKFDEMVIHILAKFLEDTYWRNNIKSASALAANCVKVAMVVHGQLKTKAAKDQVQLRRILNASINQLATQYD